MALTIMADRVVNDWIMVDTIRQRSLRSAVGHSAVVLRGRRAMVSNAL